MSCDKIKTIYLHFQKICKDQLWIKLTQLSIKLRGFLWQSLMSLWSCGLMMSRDKIVTLYLHFYRTCIVTVIYLRDSHSPDHMSIWSRSNMMLREKIKNLSFHFIKTCKHQTRWGAPTPKSNELWSRCNKISRSE